MSKASIPFDKMDAMDLLGKSALDTFIKSMESLQTNNAANHLLRSSGHEPAGCPDGFWKFWRSAVS